MLDDLLKDIRIAFRALARRPGPAFVAVLALGLGIGLTGGMFSIVNGVILGGLPVEEPHELVAISRITPAQGQNRLFTRIHDLVDLRERQTTFDGLAAYRATAFNLSDGDGPPELVSGALITANAFEVLTTQPLFGRSFVDADEVPGSPSVALVSHEFWRERLGGAPDAVGRVVRLDGEPTVVVGVMPERFSFPYDQQVWKPLPAHDPSLPRGAGPSLLAFGRLADGVDLERGQADLARIMAQLAAEHPRTNEGMSVVLGPYVNEAIGYQTPALLFTMLAAVSLVLLIACANVANLLLARASLRTQEVAIKTALGASRARIMVQLLADSTAVAVLGGILGLGVARLAIEGFNRFLATFPEGVPYWFSIGLDPAVLLFVLALTLGAALLSGIIPAIRASRTDVGDVLKDASRGGSSLDIGRLSRGLVVVEVALSFALLVATGLMVKSVTNVTRLERPFEGERVFTASLSLPPGAYPTAADRLRLYDRLRERIEGEPAVVSASIGTELPAAGFGNGRFEIEGVTYLGDRDYPSARMASIDPGYFRTVSARMVEGRAFDAGDDEGSLPVAVVNQKFARTYFPGESALGRRLRLRRVAQTGVEIRERDDWYTIVGVAPDFYLDGDVFVLAPEAIYLPLAQRTVSAVSLMVHTRGEPLDFTPRARDLLAELDPDLALSRVSTLAETVRTTTVFFTVFGVMFTIFGGAALFLASVGLYGVLAFSVNQRRHELGLRVALGASPARVVRLVVGRTAVHLLVGVAGGLVLSALLARGLAFVLFGVSVVEWEVLLGVTAVLVATALVASLVPAHRATRVDPVVAMRGE